MPTYDAIVVGLGGMGSAALYHLARRGARVLGIDQFDINHDRGSSHGQTRIIRKAYFEHPDFVPLLHRCYALWEELESESKETLIERTGLLLVGTPDGEVIPGIKQAADEHSLDIQSVMMADFSHRFPGFVASEGMEALFEADAGYLKVEACVQSHVTMAKACGAEVRTAERVREWADDGKSVTVVTDHGSYEAGALIVCGGAWSSQLLASLGLPLEVRRKVVLWYETSGPVYTAAGGCPVFCFETEVGTGEGESPASFFYGFPAINEDGLKMGEHTGGEVVADPDTIHREVDEKDELRPRKFLDKHLPGLSPVLKRSSVCMYTMTPDSLFVVDRHPERANVVFAAGLSGHGFKFAPVIGSAMADLTLTGRTDEPIAFLGASRFSDQSPKGR